MRSQPGLAPPLGADATTMELQVDPVAIRRQGWQALSGMSAQRRRQVNAALCSAVFEQIQGDPLRIGAYLPVGPEIDLRPVLLAALERGHQVFLPRVARRAGGRMQFLRWNGEPDELEADACGIPAPGAGAWMSPAEQLQLVLVPGRAFDRLGHRLGSGGGFYDRAFQFRQQAAAPPRLLGIGCVELRQDTLSPQPWDVRMDTVLFDDA